VVVGLALAAIMAAAAAAEENEIDLHS